MRWEVTPMTEGALAGKGQPKIPEPVDGRRLPVRATYRERRSDFRRRRLASMASTDVPVRGVALSMVGRSYRADVDAGTSSRMMRNYGNT